MRTVIARAAVVVAAALACGCTSQDERAYYQTRYLPTEGGDALYTSNARAGWQGDPEVYQLPSQEPSLVDHRARIECEDPGVRFKPEPLVGMHGEIRGNGASAAQPVGGFDARPVPVSPIGPDHPQLIGAQRDEEHGAALVHRPQTGVGVSDPRPLLHRGAGVDTEPGAAMGNMRDADKWDYCLDPSIPAEKPVPATGTAAR